MPNTEATDDDIAALDDLERLLDSLPEELIAEYTLRTGRTGAARLRLGVWAALRALRALVKATADNPIGVSRAGLMQPLVSWRARRAQISERLGTE
jgi:hypothetical protein